MNSDVVSSLRVPFVWNPLFNAQTVNPFNNEQFSQKNYFRYHMKTYKIIGVMSGTSLDGLDLAYCTFTQKDDTWSYTIEHAETIPYDQKWLVRLTQLPTQPIFIYPKTDMFYGKYIGIQIKQFLKRHQINEVDFIASHGHTIFHQPNEGFTAQIGSGASIYAETGIPTVCDFRSLDVALGGQGAPLVPIGDELLFGDYDACLNLGGFANISYREKGKRIAFDICACNMLLNTVAQQAGKSFDENGDMAREGEVNATLLAELNDLPYFKQRGAKSLGREWVETEIWPLVAKHQILLEDVLATFVEHIAIQTAACTRSESIHTILVTGGGAYNGRLMERIQAHTSMAIPQADDKLIQYKEALIFAFLGVLRVENITNTLASVTGAKRESIGGCVYGSMMC